MKTMVISSEDLAKKLVVSYKYNTASEHLTIARFIRMIAGEEMYDEVVEIAKVALGK